MPHALPSSPSLHDGSLARVEAYGLGRRAADAPAGHDRRVDSETIHHRASITKTFTAVAILQLRDRGLLDLDDPVVGYVPELGVVNEVFPRLARTGG